MSNSFRMLTLGGFLFVPILGSSSAHAALLVNFNGECLTEHFQDTANNTPLETIPCLGLFAQRWDWEGRTIFGSGSSDRDGKCVDVSRGGTADGTVVQLFQCNGTGAQQWGYSNGHMINLRSNKCLDVGDGSVSARATIQTCGDRTREGQRWFIR